MVKVYKGKKMEEKIVATYNELLMEWQVPFEERDIQTTYGSTHVIVCGNPKGKPVMLFHGVGDDSALMWLYNMKAWVKDFRLYAIDTLGGPGKSRPNEKYNAQFEDAKWIDEIREALHLDRVNLIGVSHGGYLAQYYNIVRHEWVDKAICMAAAVPEDPKDKDKAKNGGMMKTMTKIFLPEALFPTKRNVEKLLNKLAGDHVTVFTKNPLILAHYTYLLRGFNNMAMKYHRVGRFSDEEIETIRMNSYYIAGEQDPFQILGGRKTIMNHQMNVCFMKHAGHGINHEEAEKVNQLVKDILLDKVQDLSACMID